MEVARDEMKEAGRFDHVVVNHDDGIDAAADAIDQIIRGLCRGPFSRRPEFPQIDFTRREVVCMERSLSDVRVLDLTHVQAGPSCAQMLGFLGADVIKVEDTRGGDSTRADLAHREGVDSVYFLIFNNNKRAVTLDLKTEKGKEMFVGLVGWGGHPGREFWPRHDGQAWIGLGPSARDQPAPYLCHHQGFRNIRTIF